MRIPDTHVPLLAALIPLAALACASAAGAQSPAAPAATQGGAPVATSVQVAAADGAHLLPVVAGERLEYETRAGRLVGGRAEMWVDGPVEVQGTSVLVLHFTFRTRVGPIIVRDETTSWWDPRRRATLRFEKREDRPLEHHVESVDIDRVTGKWRAADGREGTSASDAPLDELSFIYMLRTLDELTTPLRLERHFDAERNPTIIRSLGRDTVETPLGTFAVRVIEMRVRDARHYRGEGVIRFAIADDRCRRPLRIESDIPGAGHVVMTLAQATPAVCDTALAARSAR